MAADHDIFQYGHVLKQADILKGPGQALFRDTVGLESIDPLGFAVFRAVRSDIATGGDIDPGDAVEKSGLAGTVGADQGDDLFLTNIQIDLSRARSPPKFIVSCFTSSIGSISCSVMLLPSVCGPYFSNLY
jgi:hypothetical protein